MPKVYLRVALTISCIALLTPSVKADYVFLADGNVVELKDVHAAPKQNASGPASVVYVGDDQLGEKRSFETAELLNKGDGAIIRDKTSWERKADLKKWYDASVLKIPETWTEQLAFAKQCKQKNMAEETVFHFKKSYDLRAKTPLDANETEEQRHRTLGAFLEKECGLLDEATNEYARVYELIKDTPKDAETHHKMALWCVDRSLPEAADAQYALAVDMAASDKRPVLVKEYEAFKRSQIIPLNRQMLQMLQPNLDAACNYLLHNEFTNPDGSLGKDATEAGVQTIRGMTAMTAEALLCQWDIKYFKDPDQAMKSPPKIVLDAINYLLSNKDHARKAGGEFLGDDLCGPALTLSFFVRAYTRPYFIDRRAEMGKGIETAIADLKAMQRYDGGWNYYNFIRNSCSFLSSVIVVNLCAAKKLGFKVDDDMCNKARGYLEHCKFGEGTYVYSIEERAERGPQTNHSYSPIGACSRSPLCELACMAAGGGTQQSLLQAIMNFRDGHDFLWKLRGKKTTHTGQGKTAPYYYMFSHYWTSRCINQLPRAMQANYKNGMAYFLVTSQDPEGTFHDFEGTKAYKLYATSLGVLAMHELICTEPDVAFNEPKTLKLQQTFANKNDASPGDAPEPKKKQDVTKLDPTKKSDTPAAKKPESSTPVPTPPGSNPAPAKKSDAPAPGATPPAPPTPPAAPGQPKNPKDE